MDGTPTFEFENRSRSNVYVLFDFVEPYTVVVRTPCTATRHYYSHTAEARVRPATGFNVHNHIFWGVMFPISGFFFPSSRPLKTIVSLSLSVYLCTSLSLSRFLCCAVRAGIMHIAHTTALFIIFFLVRGIGRFPHARSGRLRGAAELSENGVRAGEKNDGSKTVPGSRPRLSSVKVHRNK